MEPDEYGRDGFFCFQTKKDKREYVEDVRIIHYATLGDLKPWKNISLIPCDVNIFVIRL